MQALCRHQSSKHCAGFLFCYVDVETQQHHATHHPPAPPPPTLQVRWSLLKLVGADVALHVNQVRLASWRNMVRLIACRAVVFGLQTIIRGDGTRTVDTAFKPCHFRTLVCSVQFVHPGIGLRCCPDSCLKVFETLV